MFFGLGKIFACKSQTHGSALALIYLEPATMAVDFCLSNSLDLNSSMTWLVQYLVTLLVCMAVCVWGCLLRILPEICFWVREQLLFVSSCFSIGSTLDLVLYLIEELGLKLLF